MKNQNQVRYTEKKSHKPWDQFSGPITLATLLHFTFESAVDFVCLSHKLVIELDGGQHAEQLEYDNKRTEYLEHFGFRVLRFWNSDVFCQFDALLEQIRLCIEI